MRKKCRFLPFLSLVFLLTLTGCFGGRHTPATDAWLYNTTATPTPYSEAHYGLQSAAPDAAYAQYHETWTPAPTIAPTPSPVITPPPRLTPEPTPIPTPTPYEIISTTMASQGYINGDGVNFREFPGRDAKAFTSYDRGKSLTILGRGSEWTKVLIDGREGYVKSEYVAEGAYIPAETEATIYTDYTVVAGSGLVNAAAIQQRILELTNEQRAAYGLAPLSYDANLQYTADVRAAEQAQSFSHIRPDGSDWSTAFPADSYYFLGENLATCDSILTDDSFASSCVKWWMESDDHRGNILNTCYSVMAVGVYISGSNMFAVQEFGEPH